MLDVMYYDVFADEYTLELSPYAPPERYIKTICGDDIYIETWLVDKNTKNLDTSDLLDVAYSQDDRDNNRENIIRNDMQDKYDVCLRHIIRWVIPKDKFIEYAKMFDLIEE